MPAAARRTCLRAFTLIEVTLSIVITSILLLAVGASLLMTTSALDPSAAQQEYLAATEGLSLISAELATATSFETWTPTEIDMTVPDRDGDGNPEHIHYLWNGVAGGPLTRSYNGGTPMVFIKSLQSMTTTATSRPAAVPVESSEQVLMSCDTPIGSTTKQDNKVNDTRAVAQYVRPTLPTTAVSWKITKVRLFLKQDAPDNKVVAVSIQTANSGLKPSGTVLGGTTFTSGSVSTTASWVEYTLTSNGSGLTTLTPGQGICIVLQDVNKGKVQVATVKGGSNQPYNTHWMNCPTGGPQAFVWSAPDDVEDMKFVLLGTVTTLAEP